MRSQIVLGLLFFWLFALLTPQVLTIIEKHPSTIVFNLNEEEQKETVSFDTDLKHFSRQSQIGILLTARVTHCPATYFVRPLPNPHLEIILPPPEQVA